MHTRTPDQLLESGLTHHRAGQYAQAESFYRQVLCLDPTHVAAMRLLGLSLAAQSRFPEAVIELRRAVEAQPTHAVAVYNLARALQDDSRWDDAANTYRQAIALRPKWPDAFNNLGIVLQTKHDFAGAEAAFCSAIQHRKDHAAGHYNLANVLKDQNRIPESIESYRNALAIKPDYLEALVNLGNVLQRSGQLDEAMACFESAISLDPRLPTAYNSLGNAFKDAGRLDGAVEAYRRSIAAGGGTWAWDNLLYTLHFHPDYDAPKIAAEHAQWSQQAILPKPLSPPAHTNVTLIDRPLNIGYVSPDFRAHPVGRFMLPLLASHNHDSFRIHCYSDVRFPDAMSHALRSRADVWRDTEGLADDELVDQIRNDQIDILIDLAMHMDGNRLLAFAQSPAPVQATYLAYCSTTGLTAMNYRLTDPHLDTPDSDDSFYSEISISLPKTYWCYQASPNAGEAAPLPAQAAGYLTFGCLNNYSKVTRQTWDMWFAVLNAVPHSRLLVQSPEGNHRKEPFEVMKSRGLDPNRLTFIDRVPIASYFKLYNQIDIALDPFPYGGGTTTCDALWMGVPVVSLAGRTAVSRGGLSLLTNLGFPNWVASDPDQYVRIAVDLAKDIPNMADIRSTLRQRMLASPLMDAHSFARDIEAAFRAMWTRWCLARSVP